MELRRTSARRAGLVAVAALLAFGATACSGGTGLVGTPPAATVNGVEISQADLMAEVDVRREFYADQADQAGGAAGDLATASDQPRGGGSTDTVGAEGTARVLSDLIADEIIRQDLAAHDALPTKADKEAVRTTLQQQAGDQFDKLDKEFVRRTVESQALNQAFTKRAAEQANKDLKPYSDEERTAQKDQIYAQNYEGVPLCLNAIQAQTQEAADAARKRVDAGEAFGAVAQEAAAASGATIPDTGLVICIPADQASSAFGTDFTKVAVGDVIGPVEYQSQTSSTYLVLKVESLDGLTREEAEPYLDAQVPEGPAAADPTSYDSSADLAALYRKADVEVNPQYGRWSTAQSRVVAPVVPADPTATSAPKGTATSTTLPAATASGS